MLNRCLRAHVILLLILGQCFAVLHAGESGDEDHSHDCAICVATPSEEEHDTILPSSVDCLGANSGAERQPTVVLPATVAFIRKAWPPQTGPPAGT